MRAFFILLLTLFALPSEAATESPERILDTARQFLATQLQGTPGKSRFELSPLDPRLNLQPCRKLEAYLPAGSQLIGKTTLGVRCMDNQGWRLFISAQIFVTLDFLVSTRQLPRGHVLAAGDFSTQTLEVTRIDGLTDASKAGGKVLRYGISAGQVIRDDMLRAPFAVTQGQIVQVRVEGRGFTLRSEGTALNNASEGEAVRVRTSNGKVIGGQASADGQVILQP